MIHHARVIAPLRLLFACALALVLIGCGKPSPTIEAQVGDDQWRRFPGTDLELRLDHVDGTLQVALRDKVLASGPAKVGTTLAITLDDQPCEVVVQNTYQDTSTRVRPSLDRGPGAPKPQSRDLQTRTYQGLTVLLRSSAGPVPGSDAFLRGARALPSLPWGLPGLILGLICGLLARPEGRDGARMARAGTFGILALIAAGVCASAMLQGAYAVTYGILFGAWAIAGIIGGRLAEPRGKHTAATFTILAVATPFALAAARPAWGVGLPIVALLAAGVLAVIGLVIAVSIKPTY